MSGFKYCLNSSTIKPAPILDKIRIAAATGYSAIELWHDDMDAYVQSGGQLSDIRKAVDDVGLEVPTTIMLKGWFDTTGDDHVTGLAECKRRMEQSVVVGAKHAIAGPPLGRADKDLGGPHYRELLEIGESMGVLPAMEYLGFSEEMKTIEDAMEIMDRADHPKATIVLDPFHCFRGGGSLETISQLKGDQIAISHFNDAPAEPPRETQRDPNRVMPGDGIIDLKRYVELLRGTGFAGCISLELFRPDLWEQDPTEVAKVGLEKMRAVVEG